MRISSIFCLFVIVTALINCTSDPKKSEIDYEIRVASIDDFAEEQQVSPKLGAGFEVKLWAPGPLLSNAVALTFDQNGIAYVAETARRKSSDIDIRSHRDWMTDDLRLQSIEDTRQFHLEKLATERSDENSWLEDFNKDSLRDFRDLTIQTEFIRKLWDSDGDGRADKSQLYATGFNDMLTGVAAGILSFEDEIFVTAAPDVWRLYDEDGNGISEKRDKISTGYGIHIAYAGHDMSGLTIGPDGRIYWSIGDLGVNAVGPDGKRWAYPNQGAVMRCNPDGTEFEVFAHGLRNPQEIDFDVYGNLISVDNDGDHPGEHERYVHILEGSDSGWRINWQFGKYNLPNESYKVWMDEKLYIPHFPGQAAYLLPPLALAYNGPAGLAYNPGTALGEKWNDHFFASYFTASSANSKIQSFRLEPKGASFEIADIEDVLGGIVPTGITFASDGALYINDWKDSYDKKPAGRIWKLDVQEDLKNKLRNSTQQLLKNGVSEKSLEELKILIAHADRRVRMAAQFELVKRDEKSALIDIATSHSNQLARIHAIWGLGQLGRVNNTIMGELLALLDDEDEQIRGQVAKVLGDAKYKDAALPLIKQVMDKNAFAQYFAVEALGKIAARNAFGAFVELLEQIEESDPHMRHAITYALSKINAEEELQKLSVHNSKFVRIGAVVALRHMASPKVADFLKDDDVLVVTEAARAIHDDQSIPTALPELASALVEKTDIKEEAFVRRAINANLRLGTFDAAQRLFDFSQNIETDESMRLDALWALGYWSDPPVLDRVEGRYRKLQGHQPEHAVKLLASNFEKLVNTGNIKEKDGLIAAAGRLDYKGAGAFIFQIFKDKKSALPVRKTALEALAKLKIPNLLTALELALDDKEVSLRMMAQELLGSEDIPQDQLVPLFKKILDEATIPEKQNALAGIATLSDQQAETILGNWLESLVNKKVAPDLALDVLNAVDNSSFENLKKQKGDYEEMLADSEAVTKYGMTLFGGDVLKGRRILTRNTSAQCLRCHVIMGYGGTVGPELTNIASILSREQLLASLVDPDARIAPGYGSVYLTLNDGKELSGILIKETDTAITLKSGDGSTQDISKTDIAEKESLPSGMFNMAQLLDRTQIRDLMAFLVTLK